MSVPAIKKPAEPLSAVAELYFEHQAGKIPTPAFHILNASWVSQNLHQYPPVYCTAPPQRTRDYIDGRLSNRRGYDQSEARALGAWYFTVLKQKNDNDANYSLLLWCAEKLGGAKAATALEAVKRAVDRFSKLQFPFEDFERASRVKALDAQARGAA